MEDKKITEADALNILIQVYLSHTSKWYSSVITTFIGALGAPLLIFNLQLSAPGKISTLYLHIFSIVTVLFVVATQYFLHKVIYSEQLLEEIYAKYKVSDGKKESTLIVFRNDIMNKLKGKSAVFRHLVKRNARDYLGVKENNFFYYMSILLTIFGGVALLVLIWLPAQRGYSGILLWSAMFLICNLIYLRKKLV